VTADHSELDQTELAQDFYQVGRDAFERGRYRESVESLEKAVSLSGSLSSLGGDIQIWLVNAYQAAGQSVEAIALCEKLGTHPNLRTRKQSRRMLYILKAPQLKRREEWLTKIPDLSQIEAANGENQIATRFDAVPKRPSRPRPKPELEEIDLSQVNTKDNSFLWIALVLIGLTIGGLIWFS
jgi:tetratricopeptide (TPR) repeat protein